MPNLVEMGVVRSRVIKRADAAGNGNIEPAEWNEHISEVYAELYGLVVEAGCRYFERKYAITANGSESYLEPCKILSTVAIERLDTTGRPTRLIPVPVQRRSRWIGQSPGDARRYELVDDQLFLYPKPLTGSYQWLYVPQPPDLSSFADDQKIDFVTPDGLAFVLWGVAVLGKGKGESDVTLAMAERDRLREKVEHWAQMRAFYEAQVRIVTDSEDDLDDLDDEGFYP